MYIIYQLYSPMICTYSSEHYVMIKQGILIIYL